MLGVRTQARYGVGVHSSGVELTSLAVIFPPPWQPDKPNWKDGLAGSLINPSVGLAVTGINFGYVPV